MTAAKKLEPASFEVTIPVRTVSETNQREHWSERHKRRKTQRSTVYLVVRAQLLRHGITVPCTVTMTRIAPSSGLDFDNLVSSAKACRDGIADALGVDDADPRIEWRYQQRRGKGKEWGVDVKVVANG